jgi:hypothetical protein
MGYLSYLEIVQLKFFRLVFGLESFAIFYPSFWYLITAVEAVQRLAFFKELQEHCELIDKFLRKYAAQAWTTCLNPTAQFCQDVD